MNMINDSPGRVELWIRPTPGGVSVHAVVLDDGTRQDDLPVRATGVGGAQRELVQAMRADGYEAIGRWQVAPGGDPGVMWRPFRRTAAHDGLPGRARRLRRTGQTAVRVSPTAE